MANLQRAVIDRPHSCTERYSAFSCARSLGRTIMQDSNGGNNATFTPPKMVLCSFTGCLFHDDVPSGQCPVVKLPRSAHSANRRWKTQPYCSGSKTARWHARFLGNLESSHWEIS